MKYALALLYLVLSISCVKPRRLNNEITKVELARGGAWSDYGATISIDSALDFQYFGDHGGIRQGYFKGKVSHQLWDTLTQKLEQIKYKAISPTPETKVADANYFELIVYWKNSKKTISRAWHVRGDSVLNLLIWLDSRYKTLKLVQVNTPLKFETTDHGMSPSLKDVKFPPSNKNY